MAIKLELDLRQVRSGTDRMQAVELCSAQLSRQVRKPYSFRLTCNPKVNYSIGFFSVICNYKLARIRNVRILILEGFNSQSTEALLHVLHDLNINPDRLFYNGTELNANGVAA